MFKKLKGSVFWYLFIMASFFLFVGFSGCGGDGEEDYLDEESGSAVFRITWPDEGSGRRVIEAVGNPTIDCTEKQITTVSVEVFDGQSTRFLAGKTFVCDEGGGTIDNIPVGENRRFNVTGKGSDGTVKYQGENRKIRIIAGQVTDVGYIEMKRFDNKTPIAVINCPDSGSVFLEEENVTFRGSGEDNEDDLETDDFIWSSDIDGEIGRGETVTLNLSQGNHTITLTVRDQDGAEGTAVITILVGLPSSFTIDPGITLNFIPKGSFIMGSPRSESGWMVTDETQHEVTLTRPFYIQTTEVTQGQWKAVMGDNPSWFSGCGDDCPVERVSWYDAALFCNRLSMLEGLTPCYYADTGYDSVYLEKSLGGDNVYWHQDANGYRLPTEAEWEYAARAGSTTAFSSGPMSESGLTNLSACRFDPNLDEVGLYCGNAEVTYTGCFDASGWGGPVCSGPFPAMSRDANNWELYDMHGNVYEWCQDWYAGYSTSDVTDPAGPEYGSARVLRGGAWSKGVKTCRSASRDKMPPITNNSNSGFRIAKFPG